MPWPNFFSLVGGITDPEDINHEAVIHSYSIIAPQLTKSARERMLVLLEKKGITKNYDIETFSLEK